MNRPSFLDCTTDEEWKDWYRMQKRVSNTSPANVLKTFCTDCTEKFFDYNAEKGLCFQAKMQDGTITINDILNTL